MTLMILVTPYFLVTPPFFVNACLTVKAFVSAHLLASMQNNLKEPLNNILRNHPPILHEPLSAFTLF